MFRTNLDTVKKMEVIFMYIKFENSSSCGQEV